MQHLDRKVPERPTVDYLNSRDELDLDQLNGEDLPTYVNYTGMQAGDLIQPRWIGMSEIGTAFDDMAAVVSIPSQDEWVPGLGARVGINHESVAQAAGGWAFYSFGLMQPNGTFQESLRKFCFVGLRPAPAGETLPVALAAQSHKLVIRPTALPSTGLTLLIPPCQAMQAGDTITVQVQGFDLSGSPEDDWEKTLTVARPDQLSSVDVPTDFLDWIEPGYVEVMYSVQLADDARTVTSPVQRLEIDSSVTPVDYLAKPSIDGLAEGEDLDPTRFRSGLTVRVPAYPGMEISDRVVLLWRPQASDAVARVLRADPSSLDADSLLFNLDASVLKGSEGLPVALSYSYARTGGGMKSETLDVDILRPRVMSVASVFDALPDNTPAWGTLAAMSAITGAFVELPPNVVAPGETIEVHWMGNAVRGQYVARQPVSADKPLRFRIPPEYIAPNMERSDNSDTKRFPVFYRSTTPGKPPADSERYLLRITPPPANEFPQLTCDQADRGELSLAKVPQGATLSLSPWRFGAVGQLLTLSVSGVKANGDPLNVVLRDAVAVTATEASNGVKAALSRTLLDQLKIGEQFTLAARLSFDGGDTFTPFRSSRLTLQR